MHRQSLITTAHDLPTKEKLTKKGKGKATPVKPRQILRVPGG